MFALAHPVLLSLPVIGAAVVALPFVASIPKWPAAIAKYKPVYYSGFRYFIGTWKTFGFKAAITQVSPLLNTLLHRNQPATPAPKTVQNVTPAPKAVAEAPVNSPTPAK